MSKTHTFVQMLNVNVWGDHILPLTIMLGVHGTILL